MKIITHIGLLCLFLSPPAHAAEFDLVPSQVVRGEAEQTLGRNLTQEEHKEINEFVRAFNTKFGGARLHRMADNGGEMVHDAYVCVGVNVGLVVAGGKSIHCVGKGGHTIYLSFNNSIVENGWATGFIADDYVGLNAQASVGLSVLIHGHPVNESEIAGDYNPRGGGVSGGTINGAYGLIGGTLGYWKKDKGWVTIVGYQAGIGGEIAATPIHIRD